jgi:hypothetical protein
MIGPESQRPGLALRNPGACDEHSPSPFVAGLAKGLHSLEPGLWAALNQKQRG